MVGVSPDFSSVGSSSGVVDDSLIGMILYLLRWEHLVGLLDLGSRLVGWFPVELRTPLYSLGRQEISG